MLQLNVDKTTALTLNGGAVTTCLSVEKATGALDLSAVFFFFLVLEIGAFTFSSGPHLRFFVHLVIIPPPLTSVCPIALRGITGSATINSLLGVFFFVIFGQIFFGRRLLDQYVWARSEKRSVWDLSEKWRSEWFSDFCAKKLEMWENP